MTIQADLAHAHLVATQLLDGIASALCAIDDGIDGGYPARTSGATNNGGRNPITTDPTDPTDRGATVQLTGPERAAEAALAGDIDQALADRDAIAHHAHQARVHLEAVAKVLAPYQRPAPRKPAQDDAPDDWCTSCYRDNHHHTPVTLRPGRGGKPPAPYHVGLCKWCGDFKNAHGRLPSLEILRHRHQGKRITTRMLDTQKPVKPKAPKAGRKKGRRR